MKPATSSIYGLVAEFKGESELMTAAKGAYAAGYRKLEAYSPYPIEGLADAIGKGKNRVALVCLIGGILGGSGGYFMQDYAMSASYPINVAGRPLHSIPMFIPITFELTILCAALFTAFGMLAMNGLPKPYHPLFAVDEFARATNDRFFLCLEANDPKFDRTESESLLKRFHPLSIREVAA